MDWENIQQHLTRSTCNDDVPRPEDERNYELRRAFEGLLSRCEAMERRLDSLESAS